jgi:DNA-binding transcriptional MerR regulator
MLAQVAREAGVHPRTLLRWADKGQIPKPMKLKANGRLVYSEESRATILGFAKATVSE